MPAFTSRKFCNIRSLNIIKNMRIITWHGCSAISAEIKPLFSTPLFIIMILWFFLDAILIFFVPFTLNISSASGNVEYNGCCTAECGWFGLEEEHVRKCPFCGNDKLELEEICYALGDLLRKMRNLFQMFKYQRNIQRCNNRYILHNQKRMKYLMKKVQRILEWHRERTKESL